MLTGEDIFELAGIVSNVISFNWVEEAIDIQPATKLAANHQERLALKLDVMLKSVFPTSSTQFFKKQSAAKSFETIIWKKYYKPPALPNWVQILFFEYVCWGYRYLELICWYMKCNWEQIITPEMISKTKQAEMGLLELQTRMLCTCWFARGCQNSRPATDLWA
jgi:hypothetical protein